MRNSWWSLLAATLSFESGRKLGQLVTGSPPDVSSGSVNVTSEQVRRRWRDLVERELPEVARDKGRRWPVRFDHCFARILLDNAHGRPWREVVKPPAWRNASEDVLLEAITLGEAVLEGRTDLHALNRRSLELRRGRYPVGTGNDRT